MFCVSFFFKQFSVNPEFKRIFELFLVSTTVISFPGLVTSKCQVAILGMVLAFHF